MYTDKTTYNKTIIYTFKYNVITRRPYTPLNTMLTILLAITSVTVFSVDWTTVVTDQDNVWLTWLKLDTVVSIEKHYGDVRSRIITKKSHHCNHGDIWLLNPWRCQTTESMEISDHNIHGDIRSLLLWRYQINLTILFHQSSSTS
jgi:hypothetical protein